MDLFLQIVFSFPTVVFSVLLGVAVLYWLTAMLGLIDLDILDVSHAHHTDAGELGGMAGVLMKWGLDGVPVTLIITAIVFVGWLLCYFADYFLIRHLPFDTTRYLLGSVAMIGAFLLAVPSAGALLHPLKPLFAKVKPVSSESLLGKSAVVRSPQVTPTQGQAALEDGGAGLILQVRAAAGQFKRDDRVVLVEYIEAQNAYRIIRDHTA